MLRWHLRVNPSLAKNWPQVHSNELGILIPPLMLRAFGLTSTNIHLARPLVWRSQHHNKSVGAKLSSSQQNGKSPNLAKLKSSSWSVLFSLVLNENNKGKHYTKIDTNVQIGIQTFLHKLYYCALEKIQVLNEVGKVWSNALHWVPNVDPMGTHGHPM